jgi:hypothetical protein
MMKKIVWLTMILGLLSLWNVALGEEFHLKSGDIVSGELFSCEQGIYRVQSKYGVLSILATDTASVIFNSDGGVVTIVTEVAPTTENPDVIRGAVTSIQNETLRVVTAYGDVVVNMLEKLKYLANDQAALQKADEQVKTATGQEFHLKSGETISGEVISYDEGTYRVRSKYGVLSISATDVASVIFNAANGVVTVLTEVSPAAANPDQIRGTVESFRNGELKIVTEYGYAVVNKLEKLKQIKRL